MVPLFETGDAPRFLITGFDRVEKVASGLYCFVPVRLITLDGKQFRKVEFYIDIVPEAVAQGVGLAFGEVIEMTGLPWFSHKRLAS